MLIEAGLDCAHRVGRGLAIVGVAVALIVAGVLMAYTQSPVPPTPPDPAFLQQAINSLQQQRNEAMDRSAISDANHRMALQENEKLKVSLEKLQTELDAEKAKHALAAPEAQKK